MVTEVYILNADNYAEFYNSLESIQNGIEAIDVAQGNYSHAYDSEGNVFLLKTLPIGCFFCT